MHQCLQSFPLFADKSVIPAAFIILFSGRVPYCNFAHKISQYHHMNEFYYYVIIDCRTLAHLCIKRLRDSQSQLNKTNIDETFVTTYR